MAALAPTPEVAWPTARTRWDVAEAGLAAAAFAVLCLLVLRAVPYLPEPDVADVEQLLPTYWLRGEPARIPGMAEARAAARVADEVNGRADCGGGHTEAPESEEQQLAETQCPGVTAGQSGGSGIQTPEGVTAQPH